MTLLDQNGRPVGEDDVSWYADALFSWMSDDRIRAMMVRSGVYGTPRETATKISIVGGLLHAGLEAKKPFNPEQLRQLMLPVLQCRTLRVALAARILAAEAEDRRIYERLVAEQAEDLPPTPPAARSRHHVMKEMQALRLELEQRAESKIVRPF